MLNDLSGRHRVCKTLPVNPDAAVQDLTKKKKKRKPEKIREAKDLSGSDRGVRDAYNNNDAYRKRGVEEILPNLIKTSLSGLISGIVQRFPLSFLTPQQSVAASAAGLMVEAEGSPVCPEW